MLQRSGQCNVIRAIIGTSILLGAFLLTVLFVNIKAGQDRANTVNCHIAIDNHLGDDFLVDDPTASAPPLPPPDNEESLASKKPVYRVNAENDGGTTANTTNTVANTFADTLYERGAAICECLGSAAPSYTANFPATRQYGIFNFVNGFASAPVYITIFINAPPQMSPPYVVGSKYIFLNAHRIEPGGNFSFDIPAELAVNGKLLGGRIVVYYKFPEDSLQFNVSTVGHLVPYPLTQPVDDFSQLIEFSLDIEQGQPLMNYDVSHVDRHAIPVYLYGAGTAAIQSNAIVSPNCAPIYGACQGLAEFYDGCPTELVNHHAVGGLDFYQCLASNIYCNLFPTKPYCHVLDDVAAFYGITQQLLDTLRVAGGPSITTPTNVLYGCNGEFLTETCNPFVLQNSTLSRDICMAINYGICSTLPQGSVCPTDPEASSPLCTAKGAQLQNLWRSGTANQYARFVKQRCRTCYSFSLDEGMQFGGHRSCLGSTQLDLVIFPGCRKNN